ncbi:MAG: hypothetical protein RR835_11770 [Peptostreptococcaceae bacterium]
MKELVKIDNELEKLDKKRVKLFEAYEDEIITKDEFKVRKEELREIDSIKIKLDDNLIIYLSNEEEVSMKGTPSSFMLRNIGIKTLNLDIAIQI